MACVYSERLMRAPPGLDSVVERNENIIMQFSFLHLKSGSLCILLNRVDLSITVLDCSKKFRPSEHAVAALAYSWKIVKEHSATVISARWATVDWSWHNKWNWCAQANFRFKKKKEVQGGNKWLNILPESLQAWKKATTTIIFMLIVIIIIITIPDSLLQKWDLSFHGRTVNKYPLMVNWLLVLLGHCRSFPCLCSVFCRSSFINQGEVCLCTSRIFVHQAVYQTFLQKFIEKAKWVHFSACFV